MQQKAPTRLSHILPRKDLFDGQETLPLSDPKFFSGVVNSLREWVKTRNPSILKEHMCDGESWGSVTGIIEDDRGIFAEVELIPAGEAKLKEGKLSYVSGKFVFGHKADDFTEKGAWPCSLLELSLVSVPRHSRQISMQDLNQLSESDVVLEGHVAQFSSVLETTDTFIIAEDTDMDLDKLNELLGELLAEKLGPLLERLEALEGSPEAEEEVAKEEVAEEAKLEEGEDKPKEEDSEVVEVKEEEVVSEEAEKAPEEAEKEEEESKLSEPAVNVNRDLERRVLAAEARVAELERAEEVNKVIGIVSNDLATRTHTSELGESLVETYMKDRDLYNLVVSNLQEKTESILSERAVIGFAHANSKPSNPYKAATTLAKAEGISYTEALSRVS